ncbi:glycoside hydrolase family 3 N-terminal domain-containing protein [Streptomyces tendae]|uniref:glycoside hydrolase family 3 N-terminal domain-containing protein n=1 Tax=Streptomyces tendae TaxID=1932 RepID=UPI0036BFCEC1
MTDPDHLDVRLPAATRADLLARRMTTLEKCYQLTATAPWAFTTPDGKDPDGLTETLANAPGHICNFTLDDPAQIAEVVARIQHTAVTRTRLGIPLLVHAEALNGFLGGGHMVFPTPTGLAATFSPDLVQEMADLIRRQMRRVGVLQALSPNMDVALDPRWGRVHETYGEDPYLVAAMSVAYTRGLQGTDLTEGVIATAKHFVGYGLPQGGVNLSATEIGPRTLRDLFAFPFEAAIQLAGLRSVMNSYSDVDGVPPTASREVLTDLLRGTLGFEGFVTSDYTSLDHLVDRQRVAADPAEAGRLAIAAGLDTENPSAYGYGPVLAAEVERGAVDPGYLETAVRRVLRAKFELGLFENPYPAESIDVRAVAAEGTELSRELARRSVVLLKNEGVLPLATGSKVAVVGPHADAVALQFPTYTYPAFREMTLIMSGGGLGNAVGIDPAMAAWNSTALPEAPTDELVRTRYGARSLSQALGDQASQVVVAPGCGLLRDLGDEELDRAVTAAREADVAVVALGGASLWFNGERTEGEGSDSADIALPAAQVRLAEAVAATGTPLVVVLTQGRAYTLPKAVRDAAAIVVAPYGGPYGPDAVAEVLFGQVSPSGKLPYSIPRHGGQVPVYHHQKAGSGYRNPLPPSVDHHYLDMPATPLYPFGHGLSYTTFALTDLDVTPEIHNDGTARISTRVTNDGARDGATVVQLYLRVNTTGVSRPAQQVGGFARVDLPAGASRRVTFEVAASQLGYTNLARDFAVEPARVDVFVGLDADDRRLTGAFGVTGPPRVLTSSQRSFLSEVHVSTPSCAHV